MSLSPVLSDIQYNKAYYNIVIFFIDDMYCISKSDNIQQKTPTHVIV